MVRPPDFEAALQLRTMCNLYNVTSKGDVERFIGKMGRTVHLPAYTMTTVGPFQPGIFLRQVDGELVGFEGQWGMIRPGQQGRIEYKESPAKRSGGAARKVPMNKNNARSETMAKSPAFRDAWKGGQRCLIPADWLQEPNWETGKNICWKLQRADGLPWMVAGLWSEWVDPETGEVVPNYAMITFNVDNHPLLNRLHKPEVDKATGAVLPPAQQDKRGEASIEPAHWDAWLNGTLDDALTLLEPPPVEVFDLTWARLTDAALPQLAMPAGAVNQQQGLL